MLLLHSLLIYYITNTYLKSLYNSIIHTILCTTNNIIDVRLKSCISYVFHLLPGHVRGVYDLPVCISMLRC